MPKKSALRINKPPILYAQTQRIISQIEEKLDGPFIAYWSSNHGSVCHSDVSAFFEVLKILGPQAKLHLFIKSSGGNGQAALRIVNLLRQYSAHLTTLIPLEAASAATMMAIGAEEIRMGPLAFLTAVDSSLTHALSPVDVNNEAVPVSQDELNRVVKLWKESTKDKLSNPYAGLYQHIHPLVFGAIDRASSLSMKICEEILSYHLQDAEKRQRISKQLNYNYPSHGYPILLNEAQRIGLNAQILDQELNDLLLQLNELYSEMGQKAITDYDEANYHDHEVLNIIEGKGTAFYFQNDKDWFYRSEERRWVPLNDQSAWHRVLLQGGKTVTKKFHNR